MKEVSGAASERRDIRNTRWFILSGITTTHVLFHAFQQSLLVLLPNLRATFKLSNVQTTSIVAVQEIVAGCIDLPGGVAMDLLKRHWGLVMTLCMASVGIGWLVVGLSPAYTVLVSGLAIVAAASSLWHLPAMAVLSNRFAGRRGFALSVYGIGGNVGDIIGPAVTGLLLGVVGWRGIINIYALIPFFLTFLVFWAFFHIGRVGQKQNQVLTKEALQKQLLYIKHMIRNRTLVGLILVAGIRGMAFVAFTVVISLYAKDVINLNGPTRGLYLSLMSLAGLVSSPILGHLSDRFGRKWVLVPNIITLSVLTLLMGWYGHQGAFPFLLVLIGFFLYSDQPILTAAALDLVGDRVTTTTIGVVSFSRLALSAPSPVLAGWLYNTGCEAIVFYYIVGLFLLAGCLLYLLPLPKSSFK